MNELVMGGLFVLVASLMQGSFMALMSAMWIGSFILYGVGSLRMGSWGSVVGWSVFIALAIAIGNLWGFAQGKWKGASQRSCKMMFGGLAILTVAIGIFAASQLV